MIHLLITLLSIFLFCYCQLPDEERERRLNNLRLPGDLVPYHYNVEIKPDVYNTSGDFMYDGLVSVFMTCKRPTDVVMVNVRDIVPDEGSFNFTVASDTAVPAPHPTWNRWEVNFTSDFFLLNLDNPLVNNASYVLTMNYTADINQLYPGGLYLASYRINNETRYLAATQLQAIFARELMPCFDEPEYKATFNVTLIRRSHYSSLSNMPTAREEDRGDGWMADIYQTTPKMSVYLLCLIVCDFHFVQSVSPRGHVTRIWARPNAIAETAYANSIAGRILDYMEEYTGVAYPMPKTDHIAIPSAIPAMENWGMITYPERLLLYNAFNVDTFGKQNLARVISHEVAHQWFGNIVTCAWWDETWLNEGITSFFNWVPLDGVLGWPAEELHPIYGYQPVMSFDSTNLSLPVFVEVGEPLESALAFSATTYSKGSAVTRMFKNVLTRDTFRRSLKRYLERHQYGVVTTSDLWTAMQEQADEDGIRDTDGSSLNISTKFGPWVYQSGFPLVTVNRSDMAREGTARLVQQQFLNPPGQDMEPSPYNYRWNIPITISSEELNVSTQTRHWMDRETEKTIDGFPPLSEWAIVNVNWGGYFRVLYDQDGMDALLDQLQLDPDEIPISNRAQLIDDAFEVARARSEVETWAMDFTRYLDSDDDFVPWEAASRRLSYTNLMLRTTDIYDLFITYMEGQTGPVFDREGDDDWHDVIPNLNHTQLLLRSVIVPSACAAGYDGCIDKAEEVFSNWIQAPLENRIHPDIQLTVWCTAISTGGDTEWEQVLAEYRTRSNNWDSDRYLAAMACTSSQATMERYFQMFLNDEFPDSAATSIASTRIGSRIVWDHLRNEWETSPIDGPFQLFLFNTVVDSFNTNADLLQLQDHVRQHPPEDFLEEAAYDDALDTVNSNINWLNRNEEPLEDWFLDEVIPESVSHHIDNGVLYSAAESLLKTSTRVHPSNSIQNIVAISRN